MFSDILITPLALGQGLRFAEGEGPKLPPLQRVAELRLEAAPEAFRERGGNSGTGAGGAGPGGGADRGFAVRPSRSPVTCWTGRGGAFARSRALAEQQDSLLDSVIDLLVEASVVYIWKGQVRAGADCVMLFDTHAGLLPPARFERYAILPNQRIVRALRARHPGLKIIGFPRQAGDGLGAYARESGVNAVGLDTSADPAAAIAAVPAGMALQGNLDPALLKAGGAALARGTQAVLEAFRGVPHVFNLGHGITPDVPPAHVAALMT